MTARLVTQVALAPGMSAAAREEIAQALSGSAATLDGVVRTHAGLHHPGSVGEGDLTWDLLFESAAALDVFCERAGNAGRDGFAEAMGGEPARWAKRIRWIEAAIPEPIEVRIGRPGLVGVKRTLWLRVEDACAAAALARFEAETPLLAVAIPAIRNWSWSRTRIDAPNPMKTRWTHLWEQEFETLDGLEIDYMSSPSHWGHVDRWFDPEMPERIVDLELGHLSCPETEPVLSWGRSEVSPIP